MMGMLLKKNRGKRRIRTQLQVSTGEKHFFRYDQDSKGEGPIAEDRPRKKIKIPKLKTWEKPLPFSENKKTDHERARRREEAICFPLVS